MGLDGFSMGSIGLNPELASAQAIGQTEFEAMKEGKKTAGTVVVVIDTLKNES